jgi:hypothetical protein
LPTASKDSLICAQAFLPLIAWDVYFLCVRIGKAKRGSLLFVQQFPLLKGEALIFSCVSSFYVPLPPLYSFLASPLKHNNKTSKDPPVSSIEAAVFLQSSRSRGLMKRQEKKWSANDAFYPIYIASSTSLHDVVLYHEHACVFISSSALRNSMHKQFASALVQLLMLKT